MPFTLTMPKLSPTMTEGTIAKWHKKVGDAIAAGDLLLEISTDKATVEHTALDDGYLRLILAKEGAEVAVNQPIAVMTAELAEDISSYKAEAVSEEKSSVAKAAPKSPKAPNPPSASSAPQASFVAVTPSIPATASSPSVRVAASPLARKLAQEKGIDLSHVVGTGPGHRIMSRDLEKAQPTAASMTFGRRESDVPLAPIGSFEELPLTPMRKVIGRRLQESKSTIPHFYVRRTVDAQPLVALRDQLESAGIKITFNDCIIRACALTLREFPDVNSGFNPTNNSLIRFQTIDICVAVSIPDGLITPIVRHADYKNLGDISTEVKALAKRAKDSQLKPEEFQGGSFTISNLGMYGIDDFVAVINPPQAAILAVGGIQDVPVVKGGLVIPGKQLSLILSADHRVVDGTLAARFISKVCHYLENPALLLL